MGRFIRVIKLGREGYSAICTELYSEHLKGIDQFGGIGIDKRMLLL
jgi:hypothetical protein